MPDDSYWDEVSRQPKTLSDTDIQELNLFLELMRGKARDKQRRMTRIKVITGSATLVLLFTQLWDWVRALASKAGALWPH